MNIPDVSPIDIMYRNNLPLMPLVPLILLKLQAWMDHRLSTKYWERGKEEVDYTDVKAILTIANQKGVKLDQRSRNRLSSDFVEASEMRARQFMARYSDTRSLWTAFGISSAGTSLIDAFRSLSVTQG